MDEEYYGDGSNLDGVVSGVEVKDKGTSKGPEQTSLNFTGKPLYHQRYMRLTIF